MLRTKSQLILAEAKNRNLEEFTRIYNSEKYPVFCFKGQESNKGCNTFRPTKTNDKMTISNLQNAGNSIVSTNKISKDEIVDNKKSKFSKVSSFIDPLVKNTGNPKKGLKNTYINDKKKCQSDIKSNNSFVHDINPFYYYQNIEQSKLLNEINLSESLDTNQAEEKNEYKQKLSSDNSILTLEEKKKSIIVSEEVLDNYFRLLENWMNLEHSIENRNSLYSSLIKSLKDDEMSFLYNDMPYELFINNSLNKHFTDLNKLQLIVLIIIRFILLEHNIDSILTIQIKRLISNITEMLCLIYDKFVLKNISKMLVCNNRNLIENVQIIARSNNFLIKNLKTTQVTETTSFLHKSIDLIISNIKAFTNCNFKEGSLNIIYNVLNDILNNINSIGFIELCKLTFESILYSLMKKEEKLYRNYEIDFKKEMLTSSNPPFLPPIETNYLYTLVLDLDETLIHHFYIGNSGIFLMRPGAIEFLKEMSAKYEIVIFTAGTKDYADRILNLIDPYYEMIKYRLYRQHMSFHKNKNVKDLNGLGRDLSKVIIIDNIPENFINEPNNGFSIKTWKDDMKDRELTDIQKILNSIFELKIKNVTKIIRNINLSIHNNKDTYSLIDIEKL